MIVSTIIVALLIIGGIARAFGASGAAEDAADKKPAVLPSASSVVETPSPSAAPVTSPEPEPAEDVVDPVYFKAQANGHLDDMLKDLDDMVVTLDEGGFWRLLSNTGELAFNIGQLEALDVPANVQQSYTDQLAVLNGVLDQMTTVVGNQDDPGIRATIDQMRGQIETVRQVANQAS